MITSTQIAHRIHKFSPQIFEKTPLQRNQIVYIPRFLCQASLPKQLENINEWTRNLRNDKYTIMSPSGIGVPGAAYSRLILILINSIAKRQKSRELHIGDHYAEFMQWMGLDQSGGDTGNIASFKEHFIRCINCVIHSESTRGTTTEYSMSTIIDKAEIHDTSEWSWTPKITLSEAFFKESQVSAPTDLGALLCLAPGTLRMDLFNFLVSRLFYLSKETLIPWKELYAMFASPGVTNKGFKQNFNKALMQATQFYKDANFRINKRGLVLMPSRMLIERLA